LPLSQRPKPCASDKEGTAKGCKTKTVEKDNRKGEDWGELNTGKQPPALYVLHLKGDEATVVAVAGQRQDTSYGQPHWAPDGRLIMVRRHPKSDGFFRCRV
jgi:hypothetical protein